jgi:hypothetical protein
MAARVANGYPSMVRSRSRPEWSHVEKSHCSPSSKKNRNAMMPIALVPKSVPKCDGINSCVSADDQFSIKESNNCKPPQDDSLIPTSRCTRAKEKAITESSCRYSLRLLARSHQPRKQLQEDPFQKSSPIEGSMIPNTGFSRNTRRIDYCATSDTTNCSRSGSNKKRKTRGNSRSAVDCGILPSE